MTSVTIHIRKGDEYIWRVIKAHAKDQNMTVSSFVMLAAIAYVTKKQE